MQQLQPGFRISQPALSRHLKVLKDARLVTPRRSGRSNVYRLNPAPLSAVADWMRHYQEFWAERFGKLQTLLESDLGSEPSE